MTIDLTELKDGALKTAEVAEHSFKLKHYFCTVGNHFLTSEEITLNAIEGPTCPIHGQLVRDKQPTNLKQSTSVVTGQLTLCLKPTKKCTMKWAGMLFQDTTRIFCLAETPCWRKPP